MARRIACVLGLKFPNAVEPRYRATASPTVPGFVRRIPIVTGSELFTAAA